MKKILKKIIVGLRTNYIYFSAILLSIILFIFSFIVNEKLYNIFLSIGASVFGASILGFFIEYSNKKALKEKNKQIFKSVNISIARNILSLMTIYNRVIIDIKNTINENDKSFCFNQITIKEFIAELINKVDEIMSYIAPVAAGTNETNEIERKQAYEREKNENEIDRLLTNNEGFIRIKEEFNQEKHNYIITKQILLTSGIANEKDIVSIETLLEILSGDIKTNKILFKEFSKNLKELLEVLPNIMKLLGIENTVISNLKGILEFNIKGE
jgi:hypothetical protein